MLLRINLVNLHLLVEFTLNVDVARLLNSEVANE
jgi:hypothetical protein